MRVHSIRGIQRFLSTALALWMAVFSVVSIHAMHTCALSCGESAYCQNEVQDGAGNGPFLRNSGCACQSAQFVQALCSDTPTVGHVYHIAAPRKDGFSCHVRRCLEQPDFLHPAEMSLLPERNLPVAVVHVQAALLVSAPYPSAVPRAPPMSSV